MRLLVDANLSPVVARLLARNQRDVVHVAEIGMLSASDTAITSYAVHAGRIIVTCDTDFGTLLAASGAAQPSVVLIRHHVDATPSTHASLIDQALEATSWPLARS